MQEVQIKATVTCLTSYLLELDYHEKEKNTKCQAGLRKYHYEQS